MLTLNKLTLSERRVLLLAEIQQLEELITMAPLRDVSETMSLEAQLQAANESLASLKNI
jgi:hypothetical protein